MNNSRIDVLDSLRGLAALGVLIYHYSYRYYEIYPQSERLMFSVYEGKYGVHAFFILSGFVIFMTLNKRIAPIDFIVNRFIRLYPTFWASIFITFLIVGIFGLSGREVSLYEMFVNLTMLASQFNIPSVDGVYWSLLYELKFYFWIFIIYYSKKLNRIGHISLLYLGLVFCIYLFNISDLFVIKLMSQIFIFDYGSLFISGIMFYKLYQKKYNYVDILVLVFSLIVSILIDKYAASYILVIIYIIFFLIASHRLGWIATKPVVFLGSISYALYLIHQNIGYIIMNYCNDYNISPIISIILAFFVTVGMAYVITEYIEKFSITYLKNTYRKNRNKLAIKYRNTNYEALFEYK